MQAILWPSNGLFLGYGEIPKFQENTCIYHIDHGKYFA